MFIKVSILDNLKNDDNVQKEIITDNIDLAISFLEEIKKK